MLIWICVAAIAFKSLPIKYWVPRAWKITQKQTLPLSSMDLATPYSAVENRPTLFAGYEPEIRVGPHGFLLTISPSSEVSVDDLRGASSLYSWYDENIIWMNEALEEYGGILFRGFNVTDEFDFDNLVANIHANVNGTGLYLGTAPRVKIDGTRFVSTASEIAQWATIPTHLELCYTPNPPRNLYFYCGQASELGGETPLTDFRAVWRNLPAQLKDKLYSKGLMYTRLYYNGNSRRPLDPLQSKSWQEMFKTENMSTVNDIAKSEDFIPEWDDQSNLRLRHFAIVNKTHPGTNEPYWSTHFNVLHAPTFWVPSAWTAQMVGDRKSLLLAYAFAGLLKLRAYLGYEYGHNMVYADDGSDVSWDDAMQIRTAIAEQTWRWRWRAGDVLMLDNHRIAHGRMPYEGGQRKVFVAWG